MVAVFFIFLVACPFFLLPSLFAFKNRKANAVLFLVGNAVLLGVLAVGASGLMSENDWWPRGVPRIGVGGGLVLWLVLLHFSLRRDAPGEADLDETVTLVPYDAAWPEAFEEERQRLRGILGVIPDDLEHMGSTAVPGMVAKPVIDMMLGLPRYPPPESFVNKLVILGYQDMREANVPGRRYLRLREGQPFNLHIVERGGEHWTNNLRFRDYLRSDTAARDRYAAAKREALEKGDKLLAYSAGKQTVLAELLAIARAGAA